MIAVPAQVKDKPGTAQALAGILQMPVADVLKLLQKKSLTVYISPKGRRVTEQQATQIRNLDRSGIYISEAGKRAYPLGSLAAQVLGITGRKTKA